MNKKQKKKFTLIELIIVIVIIGVLTAIVIPNVSHFKQESTMVAMQSNIKNIETALTMYSLDNHGKLPVLKEPEIGLPEGLLLDQLHPHYLRTKPKVNGMKYWLDYSGKVWASAADSPIGVVYTTDGKLTWEEAEHAQSYNVFKIEENKVTSSASNKKITFIQNSKNPEVSLPKLEGDEFYLVNSVDKFDLESPPVSSEYQGNLIDSEMPKTGLSQKEKFPWPMDMEEVQWKNSLPALTDGDPNTSYTLKSNENYVFEWKGDMANRVFQINLSTGYINGTNKDFTFLDKDGKSIPFINAKTDERYNAYRITEMYVSKRTIEFVVPRGAVQLKVHGNAAIELHHADFVKDLSLPYAVEKVTSEATKDSLTLKWNPPTNAKNFLKVAIYDGETFLGYGLDGTFTVNSLYADREYKFSIEPVSVVGNRGPRVEHVNKTSRPEIVFSGLNNAKAFDSSKTTFADVIQNSVIKWEGDLANKQINMEYISNTTGYTLDFSFYDDEGNVVNSKFAGKNEIRSWFYLDGTYSRRTVSVIVPEGATSIKFASGSLKVSLYDINYGNTLELPSKLTNVKTTSTNETITFTFNRPADVKRVGVFRDGVFIAYSSNPTFTDTSLYMGVEYSYTFETYNEAGHRTYSSQIWKEKTTRPAVVFSGLNNAKAFDSSKDTFADVTQNSVIKWDGDLANKQINMEYISNTSGYTLDFSFYDDKGNVVNSKFAGKNEIRSWFYLDGTYSRRTVSVIVPEGATSIKFASGNLKVSLYDINYGNTLELPSKLTNVLTTSTSESVTFTFNRPTDVKRVGVFRDGEFVGYSTADTFTDTSLYAAKEYTYTFETFNEAGHRTNNAGSVKETTKRSEIIFSGLNNAKAFDSSKTTFADVIQNSVIKWKGDLANKQINMEYISNTSGYTLDFSFYDDEGNVVNSKFAGKNEIRSWFYLDGTYSRRIVSVIVPEGATSIKFASGSLKVSLYDINYGNTLELPSKLTNVETTSTSETVTFTFNRPLDVKKVGVYRDGEFVNYSTADTFTDTSLYAAKEYTYTFETFNEAGHRTNNAGTAKETTQRSLAMFSGLNNAKAFDSSKSTFSDVVSGSTFAWSGDLANKQMSLEYISNTSGYSMGFSFYDASGKIVTSMLVGSANYSPIQYLTGTYSRRTVSVIVPEGATSIKFASSNLRVSLYDVYYK